MKLLGPVHYSELQHEGMAMLGYLEKISNAVLHVLQGVEATPVRVPTPDPQHHLADVQVHLQDLCQHIFLQAARKKREAVAPRRFQHEVQKLAGILELDDVEAIASSMPLFALTNSRVIYGVHFSKTISKL